MVERDGLALPTLPSPGGLASHTISAAKVKVGFYNPQPRGSFVTGMNAWDVNTDARQDERDYATQVTPSMWLTPYAINTGVGRSRDEEGNYDTFVTGMPDLTGLVRNRTDVGNVGTRREVSGKAVWRDTAYVRVGTGLMVTFSLDAHTVAPNFRFVRRVREALGKRRLLGWLRGRDEAGRVEVHLRADDAGEFNLGQLGRQRRGGQQRPRPACLRQLVHGGGFLRPGHG